MTAPSDDYARQVGPRPGCARGLLGGPASGHRLTVESVVLDTDVASLSLTGKLPPNLDFAEHEGLTILGR